MNKIVIACDLDNTLIHSYKYKKDGDICIEWIDGEEQGFTDEKTFELLEEVRKNAEFVPVTTRSIEQFTRINWERDVCPEFAVTTNGAMLLKRGTKDSSWEDESKQLLENYRTELDDILAKLQEEDCYVRCRKVDEMYVYVSCKDGVDVDRIVSYYSDKTKLNIAASGRKIYFLPPDFNKGSAIERLKACFKPEFIIAAGDSKIDIPMLEKADLAFCKPSIFDAVDNKNKRIFIDENDLMGSILNEIKSWEIIL